MENESKKKKKGREGISHNYTIKQIVTAIHESNYVVRTAAKALNMSSSNLYHLMKTQEGLKEAVEESQKHWLDIAESELFLSIKEGNLDAIKFFLERKGKHRGYGKEVQIKSNPVSTISIVEALYRKHDEG